jgi:hypothetical protein
VGRLASYLPVPRLPAWVSRRSAGGALIGEAGSSMPATCSFCTAPSRTAMQYVDPGTGATIPISTFCGPHYHQCQAYLVEQFHGQKGNPDPLSEAELKRRQISPANPQLCGYCMSLDTFPLQILHLGQVKTMSIKRFALQPFLGLTFCISYFRLSHCRMHQLFRPWLPASARHLIPSPRPPTPPQLLRPLPLPFLLPLFQHRRFWTAMMHTDSVQHICTRQCNWSRSTSRLPLK